MNIVININKIMLLVAFISCKQGIRNLTWLYNIYWFSLKQHGKISTAHAVLCDRAPMVSAPSLINNPNKRVIKSKYFLN